MLATFVIHNSQNELFHIGELTTYTYGFLIAIGLIVAFALFFFLAKMFKLDDKSFDFYSFDAIIAIVVGFLFGCLFQSIYDWIDSGFKTLAFDGMSFMGGLIGGVAIFLTITAVFAKGQTRKDFWKVANMIAPCITIAHGFGRIGCLFGRCCYGIPYDSFISVKYDYFSHPVLATQLLEAAFLFILTGILVFMLIKYKRIDLMLLIYLYAYAIWRFTIEFWRDDPRGAFIIPVLSPSQFQSVVMLLIAGALTLYIYYFDRIPFFGKELAGHAFLETALADVAAFGKAKKTEEEDGDGEKIENAAEKTKDAARTEEAHEDSV